jgi:AcrR family transcriptional regulator
MTRSTKKADAPRRRVGRPRARAPESDRPTAETILEAARALFANQGYSATSTREIASAAGIRQPTLFHYFPSKKAIFKTIIDLAMTPEIEFIRAEADRRNPPDVALYRYARFVSTNLATNPNVLGSPLQFPETSNDEFPEFWKAYEEIYGALKQHIRNGIRKGIFATVDVDSASEQLFALIEAPLGRPRRSMRQAKKAAEQAATLSLKALLADPEQLAATQAEAGPP